MNAKDDLQRIPPRVPTELPDLERAIILLGERCKYELKTKARTKLVELLGDYPDIDTAMSWKRALKQLRQDEVFQDE